MDHDPIALAKLKMMGFTTRVVVWRMGQSLAYASMFHGRGGDFTASAEWHEKAALLGEAIGAKPPPLFHPNNDRIKGAADGLKYLLVTLPEALTAGVARYGADHTALLECSLKLCLIDFVGVGGGEMLDAIASAVRRSAHEGGLPDSFQQKISLIVAAVGSDDAPQLITEAYADAFEYLKRGDSLASASASLAGGSGHGSAAAEPAPATGGPTDVPATPAGRRLLIYRLATYLAAAASARAFPEDREKGEAQLAVARELAAALAVDLPPLPALTGEKGKDLVDGLMWLVLEQGERIVASLSASYGPEQGALFEGVATMSVWMQFYRPKEPKRGAAFFLPMISGLSRSGVPSYLWGELLAIDVARPDDETFDRMYFSSRKAIRAHLEGAVG